MGLSGFFLFRMDTLGNIGSMKFYRDSALIDHALLDGRCPIIIKQNGTIVLGGVFLQRDDLFAIGLNSDFTLKFYKEYLANYVTMYIHDVEELFNSYYFLGFIQTQNGDHDVFLQKIDSTGNKIWEKTYGVPSKDETGRAAIIEDDGLTIMISESYDDTPTIKNDTRYWIRFMHVDTSGAIVRDWREEVTGEEGWSGSLVKFDNDYIYTTNKLGEEYGFGYFQAGQVVRRDPEFNLIWRKPYGSPDNYFNGLGDLTISADSNLLLTGQILDESQKYVLQRILKICPDGEVLWELRDTGLILNNGESLNFMEGIATSSCNSIYAVGYTYKNAGFYEGLLLKISGDGCIDTLCTITDIEEHILSKENAFHLYPNPARSEIEIRMADSVALPVAIELYDMQGRMRSSVLAHQHVLALNLSGIPDGPCHVVVKSKGRIIHAETIVKME